MKIVLLFFILIFCLFYFFVIFQVVFKTDIYGTFRQTLVYDFGLEPVLSREMQIESAPITDIEKLSKDLVLSEQGRWKVDSVDLVPFENKWVLRHVFWVNHFHVSVECIFLIVLIFFVKREKKREKNIQNKLWRFKYCFWRIKRIKLWKGYACFLFFFK